MPKYRFKLGPPVLDLITALYDEGYDGNAVLTRHYPSGISDAMDGSFSIELSGFCKEMLYLVLDPETNDMVAFGRYRQENSWSEGEYPTVEDITRIAYNMFNDYEPRGYALPDEFRALFIKYGFMEEKTETVTTLVRKK